jgi:hypothetical protein
MAAKEIAEVKSYQSNTSFWSFPTAYLLRYWIDSRVQGACFMRTVTRPRWHGTGVCGAATQYSVLWEGYPQAEGTWDTADAFELLSSAGGGPRWNIREPTLEERTCCIFPAPFWILMRMPCCCAGGRRACQDRQHPTTAADNGQCTPTARRWRDEVADLYVYKAIL